MDEFIVKRKERLGLALIAAIFVLPVLILASVIYRLTVAGITVEPAKKIEIREKQGFLDISDLLEQERIISSAPVFRIYILFRGWASSLRPGVYTVSGNVSIAGIARRLVAGPPDIELTIPEGYAASDIDRRLSEAGLTKPGEIMSLVKNPQKFQFGFLTAAHPRTLEGFLFPDTYRFSQKMNAEAIVAKILANFEKKVMPVFDAASAGEKSLGEIINLASIVEKEVPPHDEERRIVAGILWKRLENRMPLQADATVVYAWRLVRPDWKPKNAALSAADTKINSPYNTYRVVGLPPGPISNPGLDAIRAALEPLESSYWYYLSATSGKTIFSRTLDEHNAAKAVYLR